ncbi:MAG: glutamate--tRNA ligase family protein, partial [Neisseriaceae bacterium]|nr:glutamate--tRNA ligase family protein [Neisseriaceae bacterium]
CFFSRKEWNRIKNLSGRDINIKNKPNRIPSYRLKVPDINISFTDGIVGLYQQNLKQEVGDFILKSADGCFAYQLAVVVDDELQGVTDIVRGQDLLDSTPRQIYLKQCLNFRPQYYKHFPLLTNQQGQKWSKQTKAPEIQLDKKIQILYELLNLFGFSEPIPSTNNIQELLAWAVKNWNEIKLSKKNIITE